MQIIERNFQTANKLNRHKQDQEVKFMAKVAKRISYQIRVEKPVGMACLPLVDNYV